MGNRIVSNVLTEESQQFGVRQPYADNFMQLIGYIAHSGSNIIFDAYHTECLTSSIYNLLASKVDALVLAKNAGIDHLVLELPLSLQENIDAFVSGSLRRRDLQQVINSYIFPWLRRGIASIGLQKERLAQDIVTILENAKRVGMQIHAVDTTRIIAFSPKSLQSIADYTYKFENDFLARYEDARKRGLRPLDRNKLAEAMSDYVLDEIEKIPPEELSRINEYQSRFGAGLQVRGARRNKDIFSLLRLRINEKHRVIGVFESHFSHINGESNEGDLGIGQLLLQEGAQVDSVIIRKSLRNDYYNKKHTDWPSYTICLEDRIIKGSSGEYLGTLDAPINSHSSIHPNTLLKAQEHSDSKRQSYR